MRNEVNDEIRMTNDVRFTSFCASSFGLPSSFDIRASSFGHHCSAWQMILLTWSRLISFQNRANSFSEKKSAKYCSPDLERWRNHEALHACSLASASRLA